MKEKILDTRIVTCKNTGELIERFNMFTKVCEKFEKAQGGKYTFTITPDHEELSLVIESTLIVEKTNKEFDYGDSEGNPQLN